MFQCDSSSDTQAQTTSSAGLKLVGVELCSILEYCSNLFACHPNTLINDVNGQNTPLLQSDFLALFQNKGLLLVVPVGLSFPRSHNEIASILGEFETIRQEISEHLNKSYVVSNHKSIPNSLRQIRWPNLFLVFVVHFSAFLCRHEGRKVQEQISPRFSSGNLEFRDNLVHGKPDVHQRKFQGKSTHLDLVIVQQIRQHRHRCGGILSNLIR
mmetsp:Transcript_29191/g.61073  ORF Transcript_29191/g.61073 Transcript_29191/m.61073 type:complete len:212 (+) Transcript_29191:975-1610(+)